ncbi:hypothetical protein [Polyangium jinanense]|uniref:Uncharacterized protein n=1 Tax=Polyangium jinanense TaxID=2829994 RepID=A0A9X3X916_9BACT|nr:hypothetical protein [Polyangium jinanense]MDC3956717.1 hypothetical protein [Polyangium jinanense]MDC3984780.1 hypothetical protein [Polyangium jinanense]
MKTHEARIDEAPWRPARALAHPAWWVALAVLAVNDHVLKGSSLVPGLVTGKLSDAAGLFLAPALLATLVRARRRRAVIGCHVAVAVVFAALELSGGLAAAWDAALGALGLPFQTWADPTDLFALPFVAIGYRVLTPSMREVRADNPRRPLRPIELLAAAVGLVFCMATSVARLHQVRLTGPRGMVLADVFVHVPSEEPEMHVMLRRPKAPLDCDALLADPSRLRPETFDEKLAGVGVVFAGENQAIAPSEKWGVEPEQRCNAAMIRAEKSAVFSSAELPWTYVLWETGKIPMRPIPATPEKGEALPDGALVLRVKKGEIELRPQGPIWVRRADGAR